MRATRLFLDIALDAGREITLADEPFHYVRNVLRLGIGATLRVFNGDGREFEAELVALEKRNARLRVGATLADVVSHSLPVHLGIGVSRGERMDWAIQKATELGVAAITPLALERCNAKLDAERGDSRLRHWRQVAIAACEQCGRRDLPAIAAPEMLDAWIARRGEALGLVLHTSNSGALATAVKPREVFLLVGPEGGITDREFALAVEAGFRPWSLGPRVLRTETAPVAALAVLQYRWGDLDAGA